MIVVISAPSGAGKTTIIKELLKLKPEYKFSVSATTREKRNEEQHGVDYYFIGKNEFEKKIKADEFIEFEEVHGNLYGTLVKELETFKNSRDVIVLDVDVKGAMSVKSRFQDSLLIYIDVPKEELLNRLTNRKTEDGSVIKKRLERIETEEKFKNKFEYIVDNSSQTKIEEAAIKIKNIIEGNKK